jgi:hypothetical protein
MRIVRVRGIRNREGNVKTGTSLAWYLIEEEGDNLVIREKGLPRLAVVAIFLITPVTLVSALLLWYGGSVELKAPGDYGRSVLTGKLQLDPASPAVRVGSVVISVFGLLCLAIFVLAGVGALAGSFLRGNGPRILNRSRRLLSRGRKPICSFNDVGSIVILSFRMRIPREPRRWGPPVERSFVVSISPRLAHSRLIREWVLLGSLCWLFGVPIFDDGFFMPNQATANKFAHILGNYLGFPVTDLCS